uniref:Uncharacterized protein n=1 Tax=Acrobeloides nanus TaxID=290746 RepID=A0A914EFA7_9BILA
MNDVLLQCILAAAMFSTTAIAGLIPIKLLRFINKNSEESQQRASWILTLLSCFGGGIFMGTCFLDIFPHVNENYVKFKMLSGFESNYPFPEFFVCCGFFLVYFLEEISLKIFSASGHGHSHGPSNLSAEQPLKPSMNGRGSIGGVSQISGKINAVMTHEIVMDETVKYMSDENKESGFLKSITFAIAMSLHSILEGIALGVQDNRVGIITLFLSLIIHKSIEAFSVGLQIAKSNSKRTCMVTSTIIIYALMTPVGSMLGVLLTNINLNPTIREGSIVVLEGLAGGTFIYVTFFEILAQERANTHSNLIQLNAIILGFLVIAGFQLNEHGFSGSDKHGHSHGR